jgi:hypothetical protein
VERFGPVDGLASVRVTAIYLGTKDSIWITMLGGGLQRIRARQFESFGRDHGVVPLPINTLASDASGVPCAGSNEGGAIVRWTGSGFNPLPSPGLDHSRVPQTLLAEADGSLLVGTVWHGLQRQIADATVPVPMPKGASTYVKALCRDRDGSLPAKPHGMR